MIKAIVFDCFGVLTTEGWQEFKQTHFAEDAEKLEEANKLNSLADSGKMKHEQLLPMIAQLAGIPTSQAIAEIDDYQTNKKLFHYISEHLKPKYKIGMLSNVSDDWLNRMFSNEQRNIFDAFALSFQMGFTKPDKRAYEYIAEKLGVSLEECVFIDDREHYVIASEKYGMKGILYNDFSQFKQDIENILEVTNTDK